MATTSTLITNNVQFGQSLTATNNITIRNPETGTIYMSIGNANATTSDVMSFNTLDNTVVTNGGSYYFGHTPASGPAGSGNYSAEYIWYNGAGGTKASIALKTSRGTLATPLTTNIGDVIGNIDFYGFNSNIFSYAAAFDCVAAGTWTAGSTPTSYSWNLCAAGSTASNQVATLSNIGTGAAPLGLFSTGSVTTSGLNANGNSVEMTAYGVVGLTGKSTISFRNARGTSIVPTAIQVGDSIGDIDFYGYNGATFNYSGGIECQASSTFSGAGTETRFNFNLTPVNSLTAINAATLESSGDLRLRGAYVTLGSSTSTTIPVSVNATLGSFTSGFSSVNVAASGASNSPTASVAYVSCRGTVVAPTATQSGDLIGNLDFIGYGETNWAYSASLDVVAAGTFTGASTPSDLHINLTPTGTVVPANTFQLTGAGFINIGTATNLGGIALGVVTPKTLISGTAPTVSSGFGTGASITANGTLTFRLNVGTGGTASSGVIGLPTATNGWNAIIQVFAPVAANFLDTTAVSASTTSSVTLTNYLNSTGAAQAWPASTVLIITCTGY
jgi:hypothetical protein